MPKLISGTDLGVNYLRSLNSSEHILTKAHKMRKFLGFILRNFFQSESEIILHQECVISIVEYCSSLFPNLPLSHIIKVGGIQREITSKILKTD